MKKSRRSPEQIIEILRQVEAGKAAGKPIAQLCKEAGIGEWTSRSLAQAVPGHEQA